MDDRSVPHFPVPGEVVALVSGGLQRYALTRDGEVIAVPQGHTSRLTQRHNAVEVAANSHIHCVRHRDGAVSCASDLAESQQAVRTFAELAGARGISMQYDTLCALMPDAATRCLRLSGIGADGDRVGSACSPAVHRDRVGVRVQLRAVRCRDRRRYRAAAPSAGEV